MKSRPSLFCPLLLFGLCLLLTASPLCAGRLPGTQRPYTIGHTTYYPIPDASGYRRQGIASWYGPGFHGRKTSNGETYNMHEMTAAHKILPMNTTLLVRNLENGKEAVVRVNDRGPFVRGRIIDLSHSAARALGILHKGTARVEIVALAKGVRQGDGSTKLVYTDVLHGEYFVQVGAFTVKSNARGLARRFNTLGHNTVLYPWTSPSGKRLYRLLVFVGDTLEKAEKAVRQLQQKGYNGAFIIRWDRKSKLPSNPYHGKKRKTRRR